MRHQFIIILALYACILLFNGCKKEDHTILPEVKVVEFVNDSEFITTAKATVLSDGGAKVTERGVCWSTNPIPTISDKKVISGADIGEYNVTLAGLTQGTKYYARAYATNGKGTAYSDDFSFIAGTVTDIDGNVYNMVTIGTQIWMAEDLKVVKYQNGDPIPFITKYSEWETTKEGAYWVLYSKLLYNWHSVADKRNIAPKGWHVPTVSEWAVIAQYLGGKDIAGGKMKQAGTKNWYPPNTGASNTSGFNAVATGSRAANGSILDFGDTAWWWSSYIPKATRITNMSHAINFNIGVDSNFGLAIRCVKD